MKELKEKVRALQSIWRKIQSAMSVSPEAWKPYLNHITPYEIDEVINAIIYLLDRSKALPGFKPTYRIAKGFSYTALNSALTTAANLEASQWNNFPTFLTSLNQVLSAFHTMFLFSDDEETRRIIEGLGGKLAENLGLVDTAQTELADKKELLEISQASIDEANKKAELIIANEKASKELLLSIQSFDTEVEKLVEKLKGKETQIDTIIENLENQIATNEELQTKLNKQSETLTQLQEKSEEQEKLITALLPDAASAGLAASFAKRVEQTNKIKWVWMGSFVLSIFGLIVVSIFILEKLQTPGIEFWQIVLQKLPFTAPCIWLGWFSAIQYGNTIRIQEDYAFKEATSKAFVGYKDHMEYLADINVEDTKSAMKMLATKTIEILAREPLRIYQKSENDATPFKSFWNRNKRDAINPESSNN